MKMCWKNVQGLVIKSTLMDNPGVEYHEGYVTAIIPIEHCWFTYEGKIIDVTMPDLSPEAYVSSHTYTKREVMQAVCRHSYFGSVDERKLWEIHPMKKDFEQLASMSTKSIC